MDASALYADFGSESEDENFNPDQGMLSDDEVGATGDPGKHVSKATAPNGHLQNGHPQNGHNTQDGEDEDVVEALNDEDDEEDEDDEDEEDAGRPRKRTRRDPRNQFIDIEAEVDDEDEADEEDEEGEDRGFIAETHPDDLADLPVGAETDDRGHRELDRKREREQQMDAEKQAQLLKERYGRSRTATTDAVVVPKRLLLPSIEDPSIWGVQVNEGKQRKIVNSIMGRIEDGASTNNRLPIISAFETAMIRGWIYVEARKLADVETALKGIPDVYLRAKTPTGIVSKVSLIPIKEMPDLLRVTKKQELQPGGYVRVGKGPYKGDLAQIDDVATNGSSITLKIVPRLDYGLNQDANAPMIENGVKGDAQKRKRQAGLGLVNPASKPPQRLFSEVEAKKKHSKELQPLSSLGKRSWRFHSEIYVNGYLIKDFNIKALITENVNPTLEEVTKFTAGAEDGTENLDLAALAASLKNNSANDNYLPGDMVEVYEGEQQGVYGKAVSVRGDIVTLSVTDGDLRGQSIEIPAKGLRKRFKAGDHVKVIGASRFRDEVGMVIKIKDDQVTILSDLSMQEITIFSKDLREASDSGVAGGLGQYDIHDLVQLDMATVACVTKVDRETLRVLDQNGSVRSILPSQISNKLPKRRNAVATDRNGSEIRHDDTVREIGGEQKQGVVSHIKGSYLFLYNREQTENSGIFVVRATNVATVAAKGGRIAQGASTGPDLSRMNPALQRNGGANGNAAMPPPRSFGHDRLVGQNVAIRKGPNKGLIGIVKDTTDREARVELHAKGKIVTIAKEFLSIKDRQTGKSIDYQGFAGGRGGPPGSRGGFGGATPRVPDWSGGRTPMGGPQANGGRTPAWGASSRTPAWSAGATSSARTPTWRQDAPGNRTPAWSNEGRQTVNPYADGSRTTYGGTGGRTPAWDPGNRTSYGNAPTPSAPTDAFTAGSKTPHADFGNGGSKTPAYTPAYNAPPTPAAAAATPKFSGYAVDVPTPGGVPTPYSGQPETPAWGGGDDGPRYEEGTPSP